MSKLNYVNLLRNILGEENVKENESMAKHTSFKVGGNADIFIKVNSIEKLKKVLSIKMNLPITIIGNGSNILVRDNGIRGIVIKYTAKKYRVKMEGNYYEVEVDSGMSNGTLAQELLKNELTGFEFASGIPGTIGGAIFMNAGAYGKDFSDIVKDVTFIDLNSNVIHTIEKNECEFSYRKSTFMNQDTIILSATLVFTKGNKDDIKREMEKNFEKRISTQPIEFPNGGSTFKRGEGFITAQLIDEAGLKGAKVGGAEVSTKHAGFIINSNNATAEDIITLAKYVQEEVYKKFNKRIELEVRILG